MKQNPIASVGQMVSNDYFYQPDFKWHEKFARMGVLAVDMETHVLYSLAMRFGKRALSVNTVSDHLSSGEEMTSLEREQGLNYMIRSVLESL
jgi:purine-nucleoside phosphorylase